MMPDDPDMSRYVLEAAAFCATMGWRLIPEEEIG
jgi:hypothetical protein